MKNTTDVEFHTEWRKVGQLVPYEYNPRHLTKRQYRTLKKSLQKFSLAEIPVINTDGTILAGHQRIAILTQMYGPDYELEVRIPNRVLTPKECQEYIIRSNQNHASWDVDMLANVFDTSDLMDWGFSKSFLAGEDIEIPEMSDILVEKDPRGRKPNPIVKCPECGHEFKYSSKRIVNKED